MVRAILDTNLWISYLISKRLSRLDELFERDEVVLLFSAELIEEFLEVASRPKFRQYFSTDALEELLASFEVYGELVEVTSTVAVCRDPKDDFILALARDGRADFLITGDDDLLSMGSFEGTTILRYSDFEKLSVFDA